jgi:PAS domain S-box-containing protein
MTPTLILRRIAKEGLCRAVSPALKAILGACLLLGFGATTSWSNEVMRVGFEGVSEPLSFPHPADGALGFNHDLLAAISREMGFTVEPVVGPWGEIFPRFKAGEIDVLASISYTKERDAFIDYAVSHLTLQGAVFVRRGKDLARPADLATCRIAVQRDSFSHDYLRTHGWDGNVVYVVDLNEAMHALEEGRCDALVAAAIVGRHAIKRADLKNVVESNVVLPGYTFSLHMGVHAGDADRLAILNEGLARIRANGTYEKLYEKWIGPLEPRKLRFKDVRPIVIFVGIALVVVAGVLWWQSRLLRKIAEQSNQLRESEERLRHVLDGSQDGFWDWDLATGRIERSERWASMLGYALAEIPPTLVAGTALVHPDDISAYDQWQTRLTIGTDRHEIEYRMKAKSGEWRWILDRGKVVARGPDGRPLRMAGTHTDITERKRTEAALVESQALLKRSAQLLEQSQKTAHVGGWESDLRTGRIYWTDETYRIHETTPEEFLPTRESVYTFYPPESRARLEAAAERAARDGTPYQIELEVITAKNRRIHVQTVASAEFEDGRVVKLYGSFRDITAERNADHERETLRLKMLEAQKLESLGVLAGGIAHDFNNLLTIILANATFARGECAAHDERLGHIEAAARRAADLCRQMLAYAGKGKLIVEPIDVAALVQDTTRLINASISKKARLELALGPQLPPVDADASQLRQVVMNLVINASEALGDAPGDIRISTYLGRPQPATAALSHVFELPARDCVCLEIADTGSGMSAATLARIFDPFFTTKFTGRGLGLAAVLGIVRAHHGALTVESAPGRGSVFRLYLPISLRHVARAETPAKRRPDRSPASGRILVADDEPIVLETANVLLRHRGYETVLATDGNEAVKQFRETPRAFDAVLLDLTMPGLDGAEVLRIIRAENPSVPALVMSGFSEDDVFSRLRGLGQVAIVRKPFTQEMLLSRIAEVAT